MPLGLAIGLTLGLALGACAEATAPADVPDVAPTSAAVDAAPGTDDGAAEGSSSTEPAASGERQTDGASPTSGAAPSAATAEVGASDAVATESLALDPRDVALRLEPVATGFDKPLHAIDADDGSGDLLVVEQRGLVHRLRPADGGRVGEPVLDLRDRLTDAGLEQGLLGLALAPASATGDRERSYAVNYTDRDGDTVVSLLQATPGGAIDASGERVLLRVDQPARNHNGGHVLFDEEGRLYVGLGDGGGAGDAYGQGQRADTLLATILRIDPFAGEPYSVPPDNPFVDGGGAPEVWAYGLRNPWRFDLDPPSGRLYVADVGQNAWEEIDALPIAEVGGANFGWPILEGEACYPGGGPPADCDPNGATVLPVAVYGREQGCSVTGGHVYRGAAIPGLRGVYIYADWCSGRVFGAWPIDDGTWRSATLLETDMAIGGFGRDAEGELYLLDHGFGGVHRLASAGG